MFDIFRRRLVDWPQAGGAFDLDFGALCMIIARGDRRAEAARDGSGIGEIEYHFAKAANDVVFVCAEQIAETRTFCQMMKVRLVMKDDFFHPFVLNYIAGVSRWVFENRIPISFRNLKNAERGLLRVSFELLYGRNYARALSTFEAYNKSESAFETGYEDGSVLVPRMRDEGKTDVAKRLAIFLFH